MITPNKVLKQLKAIREKDGLSRNEVARRMAVGYQQVQRIEGDIANAPSPNLRSLLAYLEAIGYDIEFKKRKK